MTLYSDPVFRGEQILLGICELDRVGIEPDVIVSSCRKAVPSVLLANALYVVATRFNCKTL